MQEAGDRRLLVTREMTIQDGKVSSSNVRLICEAAASLGADPEIMLAEVGLPTEVLEERELRVSYEAAKRLWQTATKFTGDEFFGLHAAEMLRPEHFGAMGYAVRSSLRGKDAVERMIRYTHLYFEDVEFRLLREGDQTRLCQRFRTGRADEDSQSADFILSAFVLLSREYTGADFEPYAVRFEHKAPGNIDEYRRIFRCPVSFSEEESSVTFDTSLLDVRLRGANAELLNVLEGHVEAFLAHLPRSTDFAARVQQAVADGIQDGRFGLEATARALHMSPRTVQRRLRAESTSHREILDGVRKELAQRYLCERDLSVDQVAYFLGFSEPSAFHRAFRRWTGMTPAGYRGPLTGR